MSTIRRGFIALTPDAETRRTLTTLIEQLAGQPGRPRRLRWSAPADLHLTLRFLGPVNVEQALHLESRLPTLQRPLEPLHPQQLALWPNAVHPRVLVLLLPPDTALHAMAEAAESLSRSAGFAADERAFAPHITLARVWGHPSQAWTETITSLPATLRLDRLGLFASQTADAEGRRYRPVFSTPLDHP